MRFRRPAQMSPTEALAKVVADSKHLPDDAPATEVCRVLYGSQAIPGTTYGDLRALAARLAAREG